MVELLVEFGPDLRMPHSRALGKGTSPADFSSPDPSSVVSTIAEVAGMKFAVKHTGVVHRVFHDLRSSGRYQRKIPHNRNSVAP